jgi:hypothetical protein
LGVSNTLPIPQFLDSHFQWMGLEIGQKMHLQYICKNLPIISHISSYNHNIFPTCKKYLFHRTESLCFYNITKILLLFICMNTSQHFCNVFVTYYNIAIPNFHLKIFNIVLYDILSQKLSKKMHSTAFSVHTS